MRHLLYVTLFLLSGHLFTQSAEDVRTTARAALAAYDTPGFAVGIIKDGKVLLSEGFGTRTSGKNEPVDGNTLFAIASNTKAFVSTALAKLHAEGQLDLDAPVQRYLPYFRLYDPYVSQHTTVRDLLCHRVGLGTFSGDAIWYKTDKTAAQIVRQARYIPQAYGWRAGYGYTNVMFITAGEVIRAVTGQSWADYVRQNFFEPLSMARSRTSVAGLAKADNVATPHVSYRDNERLTLAPWEASGAAGGIISSTTDMLKWMGAQLAEGTVGNTEIFPAAVLDQTFKNHNATGGKLRLSGVGLGWFLQQRGGKTVVTHGGGYDGMYSRVLMVPEEKLGIVVLSNSMTSLSSVLARRLADQFLGVESPADWLEKSVTREMEGRTEWNYRQKALRNSRVAGTQPGVTEDQMLGHYADSLFGKITVASYEDGPMELQFDESSQLNALLVHFHHNVYELRWRQPHAWFDFGTVQFLTDNRNQVTGLQFDVPNDDIFFEELHPVKLPAKE